MPVPSRLWPIAAWIAAMLALAAPAAALDAYWTEPAYEVYPLKGPDRALGLVIWNHGVNGQLPQYKGPPIPAMQALAARGWDVIKLNRNPVWENTWSNAGQRHVARVVEEVAAARAIEGLWGVIAAAPGTGQEMRSDNVITDKWSNAIAQQTYEELRVANATRLVVVFPDADEFIGIKRGTEARAILGEKSLPFLIVDETAPLKGHHGAY